MEKNLNLDILTQPYPQRIPGPPEIIWKSGLIAALFTVAQTQNLSRFLPVRRQCGVHVWQSFILLLGKKETMPLAGYGSKLEVIL